MGNTYHRRSSILTKNEWPKFFFFGPNLYIKNHQKNPENKTFYQTPAWTPKMSTSIKTKREKWDYDCSRLKEMRYTSQIKCMILHWVLDLGRKVARKDILENYLFKNIINIKFLQCVMIGNKVFMAEVSWWLHITFKWFGKKKCTCASVEREQEQTKCWNAGNLGKRGVPSYYSYKFSVGLNCFKMKMWGK